MLFFMGVLCLALCFVMWVAHTWALCEELIQKPWKILPERCYWKRNKRLVDDFIISSKSGKALQIIFLNRLHIIQLYLIASGPRQPEQYDSGPGRKSMSQWGQHRSVYNTIKYSKHVSLSWTWGTVWHLCYQKASWGQRFKKIECGTAVSTFFNIQSPT